MSGLGQQNLGDNKTLGSPGQVSSAQRGRPSSYWSTSLRAQGVSDESG